MNDKTPITDALCGYGYTAGPWEPSRRDDKHGNWMNTLILTATNHAPGLIARIDASQSGLANAKLIAAAPELADLARKLEIDLAETRAELDASRELGASREADRTALIAALERITNIAAWYVEPDSSPSDLTGEKLRGALDEARATLAKVRT